MDRRLFRAAWNGDIALLNLLHEENPSLITDELLINRHENLCIIAIKARQVPFFREIKKLWPQLVDEPNGPDGLLPLHVACSYGDVEIVKEILSTPSSETRCRATSGGDGKAALHFAAATGRVDIIDELLNACSNSLEDVTYLGESALHLAVKYFKFEALKHLLMWVEHIGMTEIVNKGDKEGNTVLHYAVSRKQLQTVEYLLQWNNSNGNSSSSTVSLVTVVNNKGFTAMDILDILNELSSDSELRKILQSAGGSSNSVIHQVANSSSCEQCDNRPDEKPDDWLTYFQFQYKRDSPGEARDALLVVAALFATVTFQAGINPPEFMFKITDRIFGSQFATVFLILNTISLSAAMIIITYLTKNMPFQRELLSATIFMVFSYFSCIHVGKSMTRVQSFLIPVSFVLPWLMRIHTLSFRRDHSNNNTQGDIALNELPTTSIAR